MVDESASARATNLPAGLHSRTRMTAPERRLDAALLQMVTSVDIRAARVWMLTAAPGSLIAGSFAGAAFVDRMVRSPTCPGARKGLDRINPSRRSWRRPSGSTPLPTSLRLPCARAAPQGRSPRSIDAIPVRASAFFGSLALFPRSRWERPRWRAARLHSARFVSLRATARQPVHHPS